MSIDHEDGNLTLKMSTLWGFAFKLTLVAVPFGTTALLSVLVWLVLGHFNHDARILVLEHRFDAKGSGISQSVNVGQAGKEMAKSGKTYFTVAEVAQAEGVAERTITDWISKGRIVPIPVKHGKEYTISADYRILPQDAACCGDEESLTSTSTQPVKHEPN